MIALMFRRALAYLTGVKTTIFDALSEDGFQSALRNSLSDISGKHGQADKTITFQVVEDPFYLGLFGHIAASIQARRQVRVELLVFRSLNVGEYSSLPRFFKLRAIGWLASIKWIRVYKSFADAVGYASVSFRPVGDLVDFIRAHAAWKKMSAKQDVLGLTVQGIPVGDLVNDSYLRFRPLAWLDVTDPYLRIVLWQAFREVRRARRYFRKVQPAIYFTSHSTYVQHGIPVRVALLSGSRVVSFGNYQNFSKTLSLADWMADQNAENYARDFQLVVERESSLHQADQALSARLTGGIDSATAYMRESAYRETNSEVPDVNGATIVFLHDFFDSPHIYYGMIFSDFWEWICFTIDVLDRAGVPFFVKPHPNQIELSCDSLAQLLQRYPQVRVIPTSITNRQLTAAGMRCAVTMYGTVGHEMAYMGIPTIACGKHPHASFTFCQTARSREEYAQLLSSAGPTEFNKDLARLESLQFYHMHNRNLSEAQLALRDLALQLRGDCAEGDRIPKCLAGFEEMSALPAFQAFLDDCLSLPRTAETPA